MSEGPEMSTREIAALLGHTDPASTRKWIARRGLEPTKRDTATGEKFYLRSEVLAQRPEGPPGDRDDGQRQD